MKKILVSLLTLCLLCTVIGSVAVAECDHAYDNDHVTVAEATCTTPKTLTYTCILCGEGTKTVKQGEKLGHIYGPETKTTDGDGYTYIEADCTRCPDHKKDKIETVNVSPENDCDHSFSYEYVKNVDRYATCTTDGTKHYRCQLCGKVVAEKFIITPATGHDFSEKKVVDHKDPTCTAAGYNVYECTSDMCDKGPGYLWQVAIPATGHSYELVWKQDATCEQFGTVVKKCSVCEDLTEQTLPALKHDYKNAAIKEEKLPTCTEAGWQILWCNHKTAQGTQCPVTYKEDVPATGHVIDNIDGDPLYQAPDCGHDGYHYKKCAICEKPVYKAEITVIPALGGCTPKPIAESEIVNAPTCTKQGSYKAVCAKCGADMGLRTIPTTHVLGSYGCTLTEVTVEGVTKDPTCAKVGYTVYDCDAVGCDYQLIKTIPATGKHNYERFDTKPDCLNPGMSQTKCTVCDKVATQIVNPMEPALGHDWKTIKIDKLVSCGENGHGVQKCFRKDCGLTEEFEVPAPDHTRDFNAVTVSATCTNPAYDVEHCTVCKKEIASTKKVHADSTILGHDFIGKVVPATCGKAGSTNECARCGEIVARPAKAHDYTATVLNNNCGGVYTKYVCKNCGRKYSVSGKTSTVTKKITANEAFSEGMKSVETIKNVQYFVFDVDGVCVKIPAEVFANSIVADADNLTLKVVKGNGKTTLQACVVIDGVVTDVIDLLAEMGMIIG